MNTKPHYEAGDPLAVAAIIGRAVDHLPLAEARLRQAKVSHGARKVLASRVRLLKARCVALSARAGG